MLNSMSELEMAKFMFNCMHKTLPRDLMEHFTLNIAYHNHNTQQSQPSHVNNCHICLPSNSILQQGPTIWGNLYPKVRNIANQKTYLFLV